LVAWLDCFASLAMTVAAHHVALLVGDWTNKSAAITALLAANGRDGVPLYLYYAPGAEAVVLPQILTPGEVEGVVAGR